MRHLVHRLVIFCLALGICAAQGPKIFIVTDMEGVGGVNNADEQLLPGQRRYEESRRLLTGEVNAAVVGALEAGASQVVIWDGHDASRSLSIDEIHPRAQLIQGRDTPAGYFDIPVIMLSGDQAACEEMLGLQPKAETVAVKRLVGTSSTLRLSHAEAKAQIQTAARRAVTRVKEFAPWKISGPVEMKIESFPGKPGISTTALSRAEEKQFLPRTVVYRGRNVLEVYQRWLGE